MRFGQKVLRMTWKERLVQFSWKAHCFLVLERISGPRDDFENFDAPKCDLTKTCCAWPEKSVLDNFHEKRAVFPIWKEFQASVTILRTLTLRNAHSFSVLKKCAWPEKRTLYPLWREFEASFTNLRNWPLKNAIWPKRAAHDLKRAFCTIFMESALFSSFGQNLRPVSRFWELWRSKIRFGQNVLRMTWKAGFVQFSSKAHCFSILQRISGQFHDFENLDAQKCDLAKTCCAWPERSVVQFSWGKCTVFPFWREFQAKVTILRTLTLKNAIWPKRAAHDLKSGFCTIFLESALFFCFEEMRMTWKERLVQFSWKAHCFLVFERISGPRDDFENFDAPKCDLAKTCCAWPEKSVLYNFHEKRTVFPLWREFEASFTILRTLALKNKIWPKRAAHDLKRGFCTIFLQSALFFRFEENLRPVLRFSKLWFGQKVLRMTWKERFVQFALKAHCFLVLERIPGPRDDFENFHAQKYDLAKTCCAWPENSVFVIFSWKVHCFPVLTRISGQGDYF